MAKVAVIFGATGLVGTPLIEALARSSHEEWGKIIFTSRRQPVLEVKDSRLQFVSLDLEEDEEIIKNKLQAAGGEATTHIFFAAYIHSKTWDGVELCKRNSPILEKSIRALDAIAPNLERVLIQFGIKYYGLHLGPIKGPYPVPETSRHEEVKENPDFYFAQEKFLLEFQQGKKWTFTSTRPAIIVGLARGNGMSIVPALAVYFLVQKALGKPATFPGTMACYTGISDTSNVELIAEFSILASTNPKAKNEGYNIMDHSTIHETWEQQWKSFGEYFGVPVEGPSEKFSLEKYMEDKKEVWQNYVKENGGDPRLFDYATWDFVDIMLSMDWPSGPFDISKAKSIGWKKEITASESYLLSFDKLKHLNMIPNK